MCTLELQSWSQNKRDIIVNFEEGKAYNTFSYIKTEWNLLNVSVVNKEINNFVWLEYSLYLKRNHAFYGKLTFNQIYLSLSLYLID